MLFRPSLVLALVAALAVGGAAPAPPARTAAGVEATGLSVRVSRPGEPSRLEFHGGGGTIERQDGREVRLRFSHPGQPDLARLLVQPPKHLKGATSRRSGGVLELTLTLAEGAQARIGRGPAMLSIDLAPVDTAAAAPAAPVASAGPPRMEAVVESGFVRLDFAFAAPTGAAVFRRGEAIWLVFDSPEPLPVGSIQSDGRYVRAVTAHRGPGWTALRVVASPTVQPQVLAAGSRWSVRLGGSDGAPSRVEVTRDTDGSARLQAAVAGATSVRRIVDPVVGDVLTVVTALGPAKGLPEGRGFVEMALLPSVHGLAVQPLADDLRVAIDGEHVRFGRPQGMRLSSGAGGAPLAEAAVDAPRRAALPGLVDLAGWSRVGQSGFLDRYDALFAAAAEEGAAPTPGSPPAHEARLALARFLLGSRMPHEAVGLLNGLAQSDPRLLGDAEFRGLRGAAKAMVGRMKEAEADFAAPVLAGDPASALWRGLIAQRLGDPVKAREQFAQGARAAPLFDPTIRLLFQHAQAEAALAQGDIAAASRAVVGAAAEPAPAPERMRTQLLQARLLEAQGARPQALALYQRLAQAPLEAVAAPALLRATQLRLDAGAISPEAAARTFDALRWRWRGGDTEVEAVRALGRVQLAQGRYREGLGAVPRRSARSARHAGGECAAGGAGGGVPVAVPGRRSRRAATDPGARAVL
jgi:tetratricopeptide (TPR) repeat protein